MSQTSSYIDPLERTAQRSYAPLRVLAIGMAAVGIVGLVVGYTKVSHEVFFRAYLVGCLLWLGTSLGALFFTMVHNLSWGEWGKVIRRPLESAIACLPLMAIAFVPLLFALPHVFEWANPDAVAHDRILTHRAAYMNPSMITFRTVVFMAIWCSLAVILYGQGRKIRAAGETGTTRLAYRLSAAGMVLQFFTVTFFIIDWVMSRDSHWYSSIIGFINMASQGLMCMSVCLMVVCWRYGRSDNRMPVNPMTLNDLGTMMMANTIFWTYTSIAQLIIIYSGNTPHENAWYIQRGFGRDLGNGWQYVAVALLVCGFLLPLILLLMRDLKQRMKYLGLIALLVFVMRAVDVVWWIIPSGVHVEPGFKPNSFHWVDLAAILGIGGVWLTAFFYFLSGRPVLPAVSMMKMDATEAYMDVDAGVLHNA